MILNLRLLLLFKQIPTILYKILNFNEIQNTVFKIGDSTYQVHSDLLLQHLSPYKKYFLHPFSKTRYILPRQ